VVPAAFGTAPHCSMAPCTEIVYFLLRPRHFRPFTRWGFGTLDGGRSRRGAERPPGGYATAAALFQSPNFFPVGVASAGKHDTRSCTYDWREKYQGLLNETEDGDWYGDQVNQLDAENLEGGFSFPTGRWTTTSTRM